MNPKATVLTCVYNGLPYLKEAIESTLNQTYSNFEYIIIDDCSPDKNVVKLIESYKDSRIKFIRNDKNLGVSNTFNKALSLIKTQYLIRLDQDDVSLPNRIAEQIEYFEMHPEISIICSWEHSIDSNGNKKRNWRGTLNNYGDFLGPVLLGLCPVWHPSIAFRTEALRDAGGFKVEYTRAEDFEVTTRMALKRYGAAIIPKFHLLQRQHEASQSFQFIDLQVAVTKRIHLEALQFFYNGEDVDKLAAFLRLENTLDGNKFNQKYLSKIKVALDELYLNVAEKQKLTSNELSSLKRVINKRVGLGIRFSPLLIQLPSILFYPCYYILSPLQINGIRKILSRFYFHYLGLRYIFK